MTHYVLASSERNGDQQRAVCGLMVRRHEHSIVPACPECKAWLDSEAPMTADEKFGPSDPTLKPIIAIPDRDARQEFEDAYERRYGRRGR